MTSRICHFSVASALFVLIAIAVYYLVIAQDREIHVSTQAASDFGLPDQEEIHMPFVLATIPNTTYVFSEFTSPKRHDVMVVDLHTAKKILHIRKDEVHGINPFGLQTNFFLDILAMPIVKWRYNFGIRLDQMRVTLISSQDNEPLILIKNEIYGPGSAQKFDTRLFDLHGRFQELPNMNSIYAIPGTNRILEFKYIPIPNAAGTRSFLSEHRLENGQLVKGAEWETPSPYLPVIEQQIPHFYPRQVLHYYSKKHPGLLQIKMDELASVYNGAVLDIESVVNIASSPNESVYLLVTEKVNEQSRFQIMECILEPGPEHTIIPHLQWVGRDIKKTTEMPETISKDRRHIFFFKSEEQITNKAERYTLSRTLNPDGSLGEFETEIKSLKHDPGYPIRFAEYQPFEDRMLFYRDEALWTVSFDGTNEEKIFPREDS